MTTSAPTGDRPLGVRRPCPCGSSESYDTCCGPLHRGETTARTATALMRSRYAAYALGDTDYVLRTWDPHTRPDDVRPDPALHWTGLRIADEVAGGASDDTGEVEFAASYRLADGSGVLRERSRFRRRRGRWVYLDGDVASD